jgi:hypothetical protein
MAAHRSASFPSPDRGRGARGEGALASGSANGSKSLNVAALIPDPSPEAGRRGRNPSTPEIEGDLV